MQATQTSNACAEAPSVIARPDGCIVWANQAWCALCGYNNCHELIGQNIRIIQGPGTDKAELVKLMAAVRADASASTTLCNYDRQGRPFQHTVDVVPMTSAHGSRVPSLFRATSRDITWPGSETDGRCTFEPLSDAHLLLDGRRSVDTSHAALSAHNDLLADELLSAMHSSAEETGMTECIPRPLSTPQHAPMVVLTGAHAPYPVVFATTAWLGLCRFSSAEVVGRDLRMIQGPGTDRMAVAKLMTAVREKTAVENIEFVNYDKYGQPFYHRLSMRPIYDRHGELSMFRASSVDVRSLGYVHNCHTTAGDAEEDMEECLDYWGSDLEDFEQGWEQVACSLEERELEEKVAIARKRRQGDAISAT